MSFKIIRNDITNITADAIVNTANPQPRIGSGTDSAIYQKAGKDLLLAERKKIGNIAVGQVVETPAFGLNASYILHAVGPVWQDGQHNEEELLKQTYLNALQLAEKLKCHSIAFPLLCSGSNGFPDRKAIKIALATLQEYALDSKIKITLVLFKTSVVELCGNVYNDIIKYVDDHYVDQTHKNEYRNGNYRRSRLNDGFLEDTLMSFNNEPLVSSKGKMPDISTILQGQDEKTFVEKIMEYVNRSGEKDSKIYKEMNFSKQAYSKMMSNLNYKPKRNNVMLFCLALKLSYSESIDLMARAGYTFEVSDRKEMFVEGCIKNGFYNIPSIDDALYESGLTPLRYDGK